MCDQRPPVWPLLMQSCSYILSKFPILNIKPAVIFVCILLILNIVPAMISSPFFLISDINPALIYFCLLIIILNIEPAVISSSYLQHTTWYLRWYPYNILNIEHLARSDIFFIFLVLNTAPTLCIVPIFSIKCSNLKLFFYSWLIM